MRTSRRSFLHGGLATAAGLVAFRPALIGAAAPGIHVLDTRVISQQPEYYHGWPTVARRADGELWVTCSGGRESHVCPFGQVVAMTSRDQGETWSYPRVLLDSVLDDRDSGVVETAKGTLLVTTFTSLAYEPALAGQLVNATWPAERIARWKAAHERLDEAGRQAELGQWLIRSTDGGRTWSARLPSVVNSPHGPIQLRDGRLLYAGKELWTGGHRIGVAESTDDGLTWRWLAEMPTRPGDDSVEDYHELHAIEATDGRLVVQIRKENKANNNETLQTESIDGGKTWSEPHAIGVWGHPSHLLRLRDGRLLMTYGHRRAPFGNQARLSEDNGRTWSDPLPISQDGTTGDLGYPSTVEQADGRLLTVWYEVLKGSDQAVVRQARWQVGA